VTAPADPGLQPERTALALRRTALVVVAVGMARLATPVLGPAAAIGCSAVALLAGTVSVIESGRYRGARQLLRAERPARRWIALPLLALALSTLLLGLLGLGFVLLEATGR
jgi:Domain of unknown function (DUF202)